MFCIYSHCQPRQCALLRAEELRVADHAGRWRKIRRWKPGRDCFSHDDAEDRQQAPRAPGRPPNTGKSLSAALSGRPKPKFRLRTEWLVENWRARFCPRCLQDSFFLSPNMNCMRPEEIAVDLRKISGSLGLSISVSWPAKFFCFLQANELSRPFNLS